MSETQKKSLYKGKFYDGKIFGNRVTSKTQI